VRRCGDGSRTFEPITEYRQKIKMAITGNGNATKEQVMQNAYSNFWEKLPKISIVLMDCSSGLSFFNSGKYGWR
jgi:hypothetical protein